eukprot:2382744-Amphidinium_carterae.1
MHPHKIASVNLQHDFACDPIPGNYRPAAAGGADDGRVADGATIMVRVTCGRVCIMSRHAHIHSHRMHGARLRNVIL